MFSLCVYASVVPLMMTRNGEEDDHHQNGIRDVWVAVVGGGIAGLTAAHRLVTDSLESEATSLSSGLTTTRSSPPPPPSSSRSRIICRVMVLEALERVGGRIWTHKGNGMHIRYYDLMFFSPFMSSTG